MRTIDDERIPTPGGHYSPILEHQGLLYVSGQLPMDPASKQVPDGIEAQTELALTNLEHLLIVAGSARNHVLQVRIYIANIDLWDAVNRTYAAFFGEHKPVRAIIPCGDLHFGCLLEIEATAVLPT